MPLWKKISEYENYSVSDQGDIKNNTTNRILKHYVRNGYKSVSLSINNKKKTLSVHNIVSEQFLQKPCGKNKVVNHKDENKLNNNLENLEYITYRENTMYSSSPKRSVNNKYFDLKDFQDIPNYSNYMISRSGDVYSKKNKRLLCKTILPNGYHKIKIKKDDGIYKDMYIHVLVAITYLSHTQEKGFVVNHKDGKKENNTLENLEVVTYKENMAHSVIMNDAKIFRRSVYYINSNNEKVEYRSAKEASDKTGIDNSSILKSCKTNKKAENIQWHFNSNS